MDLKEVLTGLGDAETIVSDADELSGRFITLEEKLLQLKITGTGSDSLRYPTRLASHIAYLAGGVAVDDFPPNDQQREVQQLLEARLQKYEQELQGLMQNELPAFNRTPRGAQPSSAGHGSGTSHNIEPIGHPGLVDGGCGAREAAG